MDAFENAFGKHGRPAQWRDGIFDYHHYHSTAHEALGVAAGAARLTLGGPGGRGFCVKAGDLLVLPAGTGHCAHEANDEFLVVGACPAGQKWDICREAPNAEARARMAALPVPRSDPLLGSGGPLTRHWR